MLRAYKALLQIYPPEYREMFAHEMLDAFQEICQEHGLRVGLHLLPLLFRESLSILKGASAEWIARFTYSIYHSSSYVRRSCLPNRLLMRPAGIAREAYFLEAAHGGTRSVADDDTGMCLNVHQRFVSASPLRRLVMLACARFIPIHRS
jgi:hypothetical protein